MSVSPTATYQPNRGPVFVVDPPGAVPSHVPGPAVLLASGWFGSDATTLTALAAASTTRTLPRGAVVGQQGQIVANCYLVLRGRLRAIRRGDSGREVTVEVFQKGDLMADSAIAPETPLTNDWQTLEPAELLVLPRELVRSHFQRHPELLLVFGRRLVERLNRAKDQAVALALDDVPSRVLAALRSLALADAQESPEGFLIRQRPTQQELANMIGACRETVSRIVSDYIRKELLLPRGRSLLVTRRLLEG